MFDSIKENLDYKVSDTKQCWQRNLESSTPMSERRTEFWSDYCNKGIDYIMKKIVTTTISINIRNRILRTIGRYSQVTVPPVMLSALKGGWNNELGAA